MVKKRVHELAKELNIESKEIIKKLSNIGINIKSHMSTLEDLEIERLMSIIQIEAGEKARKPAVQGDSFVKKTPSVPAPGAIEKRLEKKKEIITSEVKKQETGKTVQHAREKKNKEKTDQIDRRKEGQATRKDYHRGTGLVDRVPSRPPDRRFQEKPRSAEKPKLWGQPKSDQIFRKDLPPDRVRPERQESDRDERFQQSKLQREQIYQDKLKKEDRPKIERPPQLGKQKEISRQVRQQQERKTVQERPRQGDIKDAGTRRTPAPKTGTHPRTVSPDRGSALGARPRPDNRGFQQGGLPGVKSRTSDRPPFPGQGPGARPKTDQSLWAKIHPEDRERFFGDKTKPVEKPKQFAKTPNKTITAKGRSDKRQAIAEIAEEKLRPRIAGGPRRKHTGRHHDAFQRPAQPVEKKPIVLGESVTVQELALKMYRTPAEIIKKLLQLGVLATINQEIDIDTASILANEFGFEVEIKLPVDLEEVLMQEPDEDKSVLEPRPCVVTVMGHVDHGKTSLLDAIRETNVTATESGGITQHIGAYQVEHNGKKITFVDTPGHEAFTAMRARGAQVTDIAVLVVAADDGVMPQTVEALNHAKDAGVPIIVAINKIDKPGANIERVKQQLTEHGLVAEEWGGETISVNVSAVKREGITELLEMILLVAEMNEYKADPYRTARGTVIEAELDKGRGPVATVLVQKGSLNIGDTIIAGAAFGRARAMMDDKGRRIKKAGPSTPVEVLGFSEVPQAGDIFVVVEDEKLARTIALRRQIRKREEELKTGSRVSLEDLFEHIKEGRVKELGIIIKADVQGSVEALRQALERLNTGEVKVNIIHGGVGAITETDIMLASASNAIVIGFNVRPDVNARKAAENEKVDVRLYRVIYNAIEDVKDAMSGLLEPEYQEVLLGRTEIRKIFRASKIGTIAGCYVIEGKIERDAGIRVVRDGIVIYEGKLESLKRFKDDVKEVVQGYECGLTLDKFSEIQEGDIIEAFNIEAIKRQLS